MILMEAWTTILICCLCVYCTVKYSLRILKLFTAFIDHIIDKLEDKIR